HVTDRSARNRFFDRGQVSTPDQLEPLTTLKAAGYTVDSRHIGQDGHIDIQWLPRLGRLAQLESHLNRRPGLAGGYGGDHVGHRTLRRVDVQLTVRGLLLGLKTVTRAGRGAATG